MSCCAVGICEITDLKRAKNSVQTSNSPASNISITFSAIGCAVAKAIVRTPRRSICSTIAFSWVRRSWS